METKAKKLVQQYERKFLQFWNSRLANADGVHKSTELAARQEDKKRAAGTSSQLQAEREAERKERK